MARLNVRPLAIENPPHEAAAKQSFSAPAELDRLVSCCLLGERQFYVGADDIEARIRTIAALVSPETVAASAVHARRDLGLRHAPLLLLVTLAPREVGPLLRETAAVVLRTPKDALDLIALYWKDGKLPLPGAFKSAIRDGFGRWTDYQIAKYATLANVKVRLRDLAFLSHPAPGERTELFTALADDTLRAPDTWEAAISRPDVDKRAEWERLLREGKLGSLALVRNLRNMEQSGVEPALVRGEMARAKATDVWPWQALAAAREAPAYTHDLDALMIRSAGALPRIPGHTGVLVDVSGSMDHMMSDRGTMKRLDAASGLAVVLREVCEKVTIATFSQQCVLLNGDMPRGAGLAQAITSSQPHGGTYMGAAVNSFCQHVGQMDRLIVLTDEQSADRVAFPGMESFVVNLASTQRGVSWEGPVTRINGWSGGVVRYLAAQIVGTVPETAEED